MRLGCLWLSSFLKVYFLKGQNKIVEITFILQNNCHGAAASDNFSFLKTCKSFDIIDLTVITACFPSFRGKNGARIVQLGEVSGMLVCLCLGE